MLDKLLSASKETEYFYVFDKKILTYLEAETGF